jgi:hypothetical protein
MAKKMTELFTPYTQQAALAEPRPPRLIRVRRLQEYGGRAHYYLDGWPWPVPAWTRSLDGRTLRGVLFVAAVALTAMGAFIVWLLRFLGRTAR